MDNRMLITYIIEDIFCLIIVGVIRKNLTMDSGSEQEVKALKHSLLYYILFITTGLTGLIIENNCFFYSKAIDYLANMASLSSLTLSGFYWFIFVQLRTNKGFLTRKWKILAYVPIAIVLFLCLSSPLTGWIFYIDQANCYQRGSMFMCVSIIPLLYDVLSSATAYACAFKEKHFSKRKQYFNLASFIYFPLAAGILQTWLAGMPILAPAIATAYYIVFTEIQGAMIYNDALTGMNNRRRAMLFIEEKLANTSQGNPLTIFMLDGNKFKLINDTYDHIEGDSAIVCMAEAIQNICAKYNFFGARYGGDEFILIKSEKFSFDLDTINEEINAILLNLCEAKKKPYKLTITVGAYTTNDSRESVHTIIKKADEVLYKRKKKYKEHAQPQT